MPFSLKKLFIVFLTVMCILGARCKPDSLWAADNSNQVDTEKKVYTCPMHPQVVSDKPGNCPICGMRLVLRGDPRTALGSRILDRVPVNIPEAKRKALGIRTVTIEEKMLTKTVNTWGVLAHDPELYKLQVEYLQAARAFRDRERTNLPIAQRRILTPREEAQIQLADRGLSPEWIQALEENGVPDRRLLFHHEAGGIWIYLEVPEQDALLLRKGDAVTLQVVALPGTELHGSVEFIDEMVEENRTVRARVLVKEEPLGLKPNMSVEASIRINLGSALAVPEDAPLFAGKETLVFVDNKGTLEPREVILGRKADAYYEVKEGLMKGERVAIGGNFFIDSESRLRSSLSSGHEGRES